MKLLFIFLLLIFLTLHLHGFSFLAIPIKKIVKRTGQICYEYNRMIFTTSKELKHKLISDFSFIPRNHLLLKIVSVHDETKKLNSVLTDKYIKLDDSSLNKYQTIQFEDYIVQFFMMGNVRKYECNKNFFSSFMKANECVNNLNKYSKLRSQYKLVGKDNYGSHTWSLIWKDCYYKCFTQYNCKKLKINFLNELNMYRVAFNVKPLVYNNILEHEADVKAKKYAGVQTVNTIYETKQSVHDVISISSPPFASLQMNKWYTLSLKYKNSPHIKMVQNNNYQLLFSSSVTQIGIGTYIKGSKIIIICTLK
ncbi:CAP domain-containing protein [Strongyloides ratti]|uniref:CAP domain-containing protein n=1 Tax=Strongyloides ratti TaxID=34506 RepID=A0A090LEK2_STRRB|nr:CAP domain-containing protein [Strongyloides ratti]CEF66578.2 CAP domain-containing protein [Strongyloides ratti]